MKSLLAQPLVAQGISMKYITSGSMRVVDDLVGGSSEFSVPITTVFLCTCFCFFGL